MIPKKLQAILDRVAENPAVTARYDGDTVYLNNKPVDTTRVKWITFFAMAVIFNYNYDESEGVALIYDKQNFDDIEAALYMSDYFL